MLEKELMYNALALMHANKSEEMKKDLNEVLKNDNVTVDQLLKMNWNDFMQTNSNEVMGTTQTWFGKEWVEKEVIVTEILERIKNSKSLLSFAREWFTDNDKILFPVKGKRVRMVLLEENKDQPQNKTLTSKQVKKVGTPLVEVNTKELIITIYFSDKLLRQSVLAIANYIMGEIFEAYEKSAHEIILNWDTATTNNINCADGNIETDLPDWAKTDLLGFDWARKTAIQKWATVDAWGNLDLIILRKGRAKMWIKGMDPDKVKLVPSQWAYFDLMNLTEAETIEKFWDTATVKNGKLVAIDWMEIINREELTLTQADWTISKIPENNTAEQMVLVHVNSLLYGNTYALTTELSRYAEEKTTGITWSTGIGLGWDDEQNNERSTSPVALIVNI